MIVSKDAAPVKEIIRTGDQVDLYELPLLKHHEMDGGPYVDMSSVAKDRASAVYNCSYHRMEVKDRNHTGFLMSFNICGASFAVTKRPARNVPSRP